MKTRIEIRKEAVIKVEAQLEVEAIAEVEVGVGGGVIAGGEVPVVDEATDQDQMNILKDQDYMLLI